MTDATLLTRLAEHRGLAPTPASEREWLARHGVLYSLAPGDVLTHKGAQSLGLHVFLTGHVVIRVDRGAGAHKIFEWRGGDLGGAVPYSRGASPPSDAIAEEPTDILLVPRDLFPELIRECPETTTILVRTMVDRARQFTSNDLRDEKLLSLGRLAAGLAHELNNPASAVIRGARTLAQSQAASESAARRLEAARLTEAQLAAIDTVRGQCRSPGGATASALDRADREDALGTWLAAHRVGTECAGSLAATGVTIQALDTLAAAVNGDALDAAVRWIAAGCMARTVTAEVETAATRIYELVNAVKGFTFMDHAPIDEPVDIKRGLADTITMLGAKIRGKSAQVSLNVADDLPRAHGVGGELNQVWMNLLDNALDAVRPGGRVEVSAVTELGTIVVRIVDDGPGIPDAIRGRIFDPFFTTKGVGKGTGLGLDLVRRLVQRHEGQIDVDSRPGRTEFRVNLRPTVVS